MCYEDLKQLYAAAAKERDELKKELEHTKRLYEMAKNERDALEDEIRGMCDRCVHYNKGWGDQLCHDCGPGNNWEWNGPKEA